MILLSEKVDKVQFDDVFNATGKCESMNAIKPSWSSSQTVGKKPGFFARLIGFEKDAVTDE